MFGYDKTFLPRVFCRDGTAGDVQGGEEAVQEQGSGNEDVDEVSNADGHRHGEVCSD